MFQRFRRKPSSSVQQARSLIGEAVAAMYACKRDRHYKPSEDELRMIEQFEQHLWESYCAAQYLSRSLRSRAKGQAETAPRWHRRESFDYHCGENATTA